MIPTKMDFIKLSLLMISFCFIPEQVLAQQTGWPITSVGLQFVVVNETDESIDVLIKNPFVGDTSVSILGVDVNGMTNNSNSFIIGKGQSANVMVKMKAKGWKYCSIEASGRGQERNYYGEVCYHSHGSSGCSTFSEITFYADRNPTVRE